MPLVTSTEMFKKAYEGHYAVGHPTLTTWKSSRYRCRSPNKKKISVDSASIRRCS